MVLLAPAPKPDYAAALRVLGDLPALLKARQVSLGLTTPIAAKQIGVTTATLTNLYGRSNPNITTVTACLRWLAAQR